MRGAAVSESPVTIELNPREQRLYDRLRIQVSERRPGASAGIRDLLLLLPDLVVCLILLLIAVTILYRKLSCSRPTIQSSEQDYFQLQYKLVQLNIYLYIQNCL